ncbi:MAG: alkaline phosphatase [Rikenellaceae bacterium]
MKRLLAIFIAFVFVSCISNETVSGVKSEGDISLNNKAKYIFYFIGDGMSASQVRLAEAALTASEFQENYARHSNSTSIIEELNIKSLSVTGLATSNAQNRYITDSAAAGTALATGHKTNVGVISESADGEKLETIAETLKGQGMKIGIVSSVSIDHATPACFYAHTSSRNNYSSISDQLLTSDFDYFAGGSVKWDKRAKDENTDKATAYAAYKTEAEQNGFKFVTTKSEFDQCGRGEAKRVIATLDMLANNQYTGDGSALPYTIDLAKQNKDDNRISLAQFTQKGIDILDNESGFFMMVEGGKIDWACHANDAATCAYEVVAFDEAIGVALKFAAQHPTQTLIVVTGDHDCGGLALGFAGTGYDSAFDILAKSKTSYLEFTQETKRMIGEGANFKELLEYTEKSLGLSDKATDGSKLSDYEVDMLRDAYKKSAQRDKLNDTDKYYASYGGYDPFTTTCTQILNNKSGIEFTSYSHTAVPVMVFANGANAELFSGYYDNTDIAKKILKAAGL